MESWQGFCSDWPPPVTHAVLNEDYGIIGVKKCIT